MHIATGYGNSLSRRRERWTIVDIDIPAACRNTTFHVRDHGGRMRISGGIRHNIVQRIENWPIVIAVTYMDMVRMSAVSSKSYNAITRRCARHSGHAAFPFFVAVIE